MGEELHGGHYQRQPADGQGGGGGGEGHEHRQQRMQGEKVLLGENRDGSHRDNFGKSLKTLSATKSQLEEVSF